MVAMNVWPTDAADGSVSSEARWRKMARYWAPTGVLLGTGSEMVPTLAYPNLTVKAGACWVDGHYCELTGDQVLAVTPNGLAVVRFDPAANSAQLLYLDGVTQPAQSPTGTFEVAIAQIIGSALTDRRRPVGAPANGGIYGVTMYEAVLAANYAGTITPTSIVTIPMPAAPAGSLLDLGMLVYTSTALGIGNGYFNFKVNGVTVGSTTVTPDLNIVQTYSGRVVNIPQPVGIPYNIEMWCAKAAAGGTLTAIGGVTRLSVVSYRP